MSGALEYFVWSHEHSAWWGPGRNGYTPDVTKAGIYTREVALEICVNARGGWKPGTPPNEIPVRVVDQFAIDVGWQANVRNRKPQED